MASFRATVRKWHPRLFSVHQQASVGYRREQCQPRGGGRYASTEALSQQKVPGARTSSHELLLRNDSC